MYDAKRVTIAVAQPAEQGACDALSSKHTEPRSQRDVHRMRLAMHRPRAVRCLPQMHGLRLAARASSRATATLRFREGERELARVRFHDP